jgi:lipid-A-disaccharide synthase
MTRIGLVAGETSGDLLAASVLPHLGQAHCAGIGGPALQAAGFEAWWPSELLAVRGYVEVLRAYPRLLALRRQIRQRMLSWHPKLFVGVDAPDFNLELERRLREAGCQTAHFIGPSIWAWRPGRIERIRAAAHHVLLLFPFEQAIYDRAGIPATYVGHPMADEIGLSVDTGQARQALGLDRSRPTVAVLPGSRSSEIQAIAPVFLDALQRMARARSDLQFVIPAATPRLYAALRALLSRIDPGGATVILLEGQARWAIAAADSVLVASGTATLEVALLRKPMVIAYRMAAISYQIMRRMQMLPWIGLPNILSNESLVPEFIQHEATPEALSRAVLAQLDDDALRARLAERFEALHHALRRDCGRRAAEVMLDLAQRRPRSTPAGQAA